VNSSAAERPAAPNAVLIAKISLSEGTSPSPNPPLYLLVAFTISHVLNRQVYSTSICCRFLGPKIPTLRPQGLGAYLPARILIVDDHPIARTAIGSLLNSHSFHICGEAQDGKEAIEKVRELQPDLVLLDISMPVMNGIQAAMEIRRIAPATKIIFLSNHDIPIIVDATRKLADGFVPKSAADIRLIPTLNRIAGISPDGPLKSRHAATG
jgi:two-component system, chemotaxis family, chemotaxis protein CheY